MEVLHDSLNLNYLSWKFMQEWRAILEVMFAGSLILKTVISCNRILQIMISCNHISYMLSREYHVAGYRYSQLLFTSEDCLCRCNDNRWIWLRHSWKLLPNRLTRDKKSLSTVTHALFFISTTRIVLYNLHQCYKAVTHAIMTCHIWI